MSGHAPAYMPSSPVLAASRQLGTQGPRPFEPQTAHERESRPGLGETDEQARAQAQRTMQSHQASQYYRSFGSTASFTAVMSGGSARPQASPAPLTANTLPTNTLPTYIPPRAPVDAAGDTEMEDDDGVEAVCAPPQQHKHEHGPPQLQYDESRTYSEDRAGESDVLFERAMGRLVRQVRDWDVTEHRPGLWTPPT